MTEKKRLAILAKVRKEFAKDKYVFRGLGTKKVKKAGRLPINAW